MIFVDIATILVCTAIFIAAAAMNAAAFFTKEGRESGIWILTGMMIVPGGAAAIFLIGSAVDLYQRIF